ncbi:hypothetical protein EMIHUDRAFT_199481 [Emiliania huxleyi CCMP1516]|uniref:TNFR-Cys domain-containing protein n=2 Tax=Emiliania huxleyi TaxID=2903 RepID=A0A0D3KZP1_EMIH1|nr:hypothetical protein EMIHUDRAFT_199481 [Emiliania huxleyi CCMP1516]EOD41226.1 hypothetical protein EMIHUDRAFT_199481 [Emiliania huxleyi CCMP1516]|eukprot:XP_005793655.1 hypothetical protein EMIHUDRAFT_199481 [Emiliania huxleyi CCMP1516]
MDSSVDGRCRLGTDCADCGERHERDVGAFLCSTSCTGGLKGQCDDGGPGSRTTDCAFGSDCDDCGVRFAENDDCDDGVITLCRDDHANCAFCAFASDCGDCGKRQRPCKDPHPEDALEDEEGYYDDVAVTTSTAFHASAGCHGAGEARCEPSCNLLHGGIGQCSSCACSRCAYCVPPEFALRHPPPPSSRAPLAASRFSCDMLEARHNLLAREAPLHCYSLQSSAQCELAFTYDAQAAQIPLSVCHWCGGLGYAGLSTCCSTAAHPASCFALDEFSHHCRPACDDPSWACFPKSELPSPAAKTPHRARQTSNMLSAMVALPFFVIAALAAAATRWYCQQSKPKARLSTRAIEKTPLSSRAVEGGDPEEDAESVVEMVSARAALIDAGQRY